ncbi:MAG: PAS domain S-box protein [Nitrospinae bacterium]|nr:PAS domain S-box protein [Nitrospinota bacterium]
MSKAKSPTKTSKGKTRKRVSKNSPKPKTISKNKKSRAFSKRVKKKTSRPNSETLLKTRLRYEKALAACAQELLVNPKSSPQPIQDSIEHLLKAAQVSRIYIFENFNDLKDGLCVRQVYETVATGIKPEIDNPDLQHFPLIGAGFDRWAKLLPQGKHIGGTVSKFPQPEREVLEAQDILSLLVLPIFVDGKWYGFIGFDDCVSTRKWSEDDIRILRTASEIIGGYLSQKKMEKLLQDTHARLEVQLKKQKDHLQSVHQSLNQEAVKRERSVRALEESEECLRQLAENLEDIFWMTSPSGKEIIYVSPAIEKIFGITPETLYKDPSVWLSTVHPEDRDRVLENFTEYSLPQGQNDIEYRIIPPDGAVRWIAARGFPVKNNKGEVYRIAGIASDITGQKEMEKQILESEERFRSLVDQAPDPIFVRDFNGKLILVNPRVCECLGYTREELLQMSIADIVVNFDFKSVNEKFKQLPSGETFTLEGWHRRRNGSTFPVEAHLGTIFWRGQLRVLSITRDMTQRKRVEQELLRTKEKAEQASRAKSEFLSRVSHEFRTPLNAILGFGQLLDNYTSKPSSKLQHSHVKEILHAGQHLLELINDVLDLSKIESGKMDLNLKAIPLKGLLEDSLGLVETMANDSGITLHANLSGLEGLMVSGDSTRLKQVFLNLLTNAIKYNCSGGSVDIGIENISEEEIQVFIQDTGLGIPPDKMKIIFEPFHRLEAGPSPVPGTGMGLSIVKTLLSMMNGFIEVESGAEGGSRFVVGLARISELGDQVEKNKVSSTTNTLPIQEGEKYLVLYIEDNPSNMCLVQQVMLKRPQVELLSADHPRTGIALARNQRPHLILLDINLPDMDGYTVLKLLQGYEETCDIPVIAISAHAMPEDVDKALSLGFHNYLSKPIDVETLLNLIDSVLASNPR